MSASFVASQDDLTNLASFIGTLSEASRETGVRLFDRATLDVRDGNRIDIVWSDEAEAYAVDDLVGS